MSDKKRIYTAKELIDAIDAFDDETVHSNEESEPTTDISKFMVEGLEYTEEEKRKMEFTQKLMMQKENEESIISHMDYTYDEIKDSTKEIINLQLHDLEIIDRILNEKLEKLIEPSKITVLYDNDETSIVNQIQLDFVLYFNAKLIISAQKNHYWEFCAIDTYKNTFNQRLADFIRIHQSATEADFIQMEEECIGRNNFELKHKNGKALQLQNYLPEHIQTELSISKKRKLDFLDERLAIFKEAEKAKKAKLAEPKNFPDFDHEDIFTDYPSFRVFELYDDQLNKKGVIHYTIYSFANI